MKINQKQTEQTDLFFDNIKRRMVDITVQIRHAEKNNVSNTAKSGYYRAAIILACTITEGLLYNMVEVQTRGNNNSMGKRIVYKYTHNIPKEYCDKKIVLCIAEEKDIILSSDTKFQELIRYSLENNLISKKREQRDRLCKKIKKQDTFTIFNRQR